MCRVFPNRSMAAVLRLGLAGFALLPAIVRSHDLPTDRERLAVAGPFAVRGWGVAHAGSPYQLGQVMDAPPLRPGALTRLEDGSGYRVVLTGPDRADGVGPMVPYRWESSLPGDIRLTLEADDEVLARDWWESSRTVGLACGEFHTLFLKRDGTVRAQGWNGAGQATVPHDLREVVAVAAGMDHSLAVRADGRVVGWGRSDAGQITIPEAANHGFVAAAGGVLHSVLLRSDGTVEILNPAFLPAPSAGMTLTGLVAVAAGAAHSLALTRSGRVLAWGPAPDGITRVPDDAAPAVAIAAGAHFSLALRADGRVLAWGDGRYGQTDIPDSATNVVAIAAGSYHAVALRTDGTLVAWGDGSQGQTTVPGALTGGVAVAAGGFHTQVLTRELPPLGLPQPGVDGLDVELHLPAGQAWEIQFTDDWHHWEPVRRGVARFGAWTARLPCLNASHGAFRLRPMPIADAPPLSENRSLEP
ncbi:MAG: hypothetical protein KF833_06045 [Verrucomicrobiae bacterium]|nr:hypothetical protein [Verrucomicrobiae bacterium]